RAMTRDISSGRLRKTMRIFRAAERGNVAVIFGLAVIPIMAAVGAAVDYGEANRYRSMLQAAADAAAGGPVAKSSPAMAAATTMTQDGPIPAGVTDATNIFNGLIADKRGWSGLSLDVTVARSNGTVTSTVQFTASVPTMFLGILGMSSLAVSGSVSASNGIPLFADFYLLLDNSPSMGLGATTADIDALIAATASMKQDPNCAFACHDLSGVSDYYTLAKQKGITMRIDVLRQATQQLMDTAQNSEGYSDQFRMAIYTLGTSATSMGLTTIQSLTSNLSMAKSSASNIDLMTVPYQNYDADTQTDLYNAMRQMDSEIKQRPGDGTSSSSPLKYLFFVSDGVQDRHQGSGACAGWSGVGTDPQTGKIVNRCEEPIDVSACDTLKKRGVKIAVLYTTYLPITNNSWYNTTVAPWASQIPVNMKACASSDLYFEVSPSQGITEAMNALFKKVVAAAHLTK